MHFINAIPFIFSFLILIVTSSHPVTVSLFFSHHNGVVSLSLLLIVIFWFFWVSSLPMSVTTRSDRCLHPNYFAERSYCRHIPPLGSLLLDSYSAVVTMSPMLKDIAATLYLYPLFLPLAAHLPIFFPGSLYDSAALIAPEGGNTYRIWRPPRCGHWRSCCRPQHK